MRTICVYNRKGGVGKSTIVSLITREATEAGLKVLVIDTDSQRNFALYYRVNPDTKPFDDFVKEKVTFEDCIYNVNENLDMIWVQSPMGISRAISMEHNKSKYFKSLMSEVFDYDYDLVIFDSPPSENELTYQILSFVDDIIIPVNAAISSTKALYDTYSIITDTLDLETDKIKQVIPNMIEKNTLIARQNLKDVKSVLKELDLMSCLTVAIPKREAIKRATEYGKDIREIDKDVAHIVKRIVNDYVNKLKVVMANE